MMSAGVFVYLLVTGIAGVASIALASGSGIGVASLERACWRS
jgi:hypothetical protein